MLFTLLFAQAKNKPSARTGPGILCRLRHTDQKGKVLRSCTKRATTPDGTGHPVPFAAHLLKRQGAAQLHTHFTPGGLTKQRNRGKMGYSWPTEKQTPVFSGGQKHASG
ncbi:hypothetical protein D1157_16060 [Anaerotruncus sp. X29]|nr:hypothetical protein [Anaerotruncus sp. X29]